MLSKACKRTTLSLIRYADDFVILHKEYSVVQRCREIISEWLNDMGLELKPSKTRISHTMHNVGIEKAGFDFLGFNITQVKVGKHNSGKYCGKLLGYKTIIKPCKKSIRSHYSQITDIVNNSKSMKQEQLIARLNPITKGWCNYFSAAVSAKTFKLLDKIIFWKLWKWGIKRHGNKGKTWLKSKYFLNESFYDDKKHKYVSKDWIFATTENESIKYRLTHHADTKITRHVKVKGDASPYDGNLVYWSSRMGKNPLMPNRKAKLLKTQKGKCEMCNLTFRYGDVIEVDHIIPTSKGGKDSYKNLQLLHRHCHDEKTSTDGTYDRPFKPVKLPTGWYWSEGMLIT